MDDVKTIWDTVAELKAKGLEPTDEQHEELRAWFRTQEKISDSSTIGLCGETPIMYELRVYIPGDEKIGSMSYLHGLKELFDDVIRDMIPSGLIDKLKGESN